MLQRIGNNFIRYRFQFYFLSSSVCDLYGIYLQVLFCFVFFYHKGHWLQCFCWPNAGGWGLQPSSQWKTLLLTYRRLCGYSGYMVSHLQVQPTVGHVVPSLHYWKKFDLHSSNTSCSRINCVYSIKGEAMHLWKGS